MKPATQPADIRVPASDTLDVLLDGGSARKIDDTAGLNLALGRVHGRPTAVFILREQPQSVADLRRLRTFVADADARGDVLIGIHADTAVIDADGDAYEAQATLLHALGQASRHVPYLAVSASSQGGVNALLCAQAHAVFMLAGAGALYLSGPDSVLAVRGLALDEQTLGGSQVHEAQSGLAARTCLHLVDALLQLRRYAGLLDGGGRAAAASPIDDEPVQPALSTLRAGPHTPYDMRELIANLADHADWFETHAAYGGAVITGLARLHGRTVGIVANDPGVNAASLDAEACRKAAAFVELCSRRRYIVLSIVDTPGFLPGPEQEAAGIVSAAQALIGAWSRSASKRITLLTGRALGGAGMAMGLGIPEFDRAALLAWPDARIAASGSSHAPGMRANASNALDIIEPSRTRAALARAIMPMQQRYGA